MVVARSLRRWLPTLALLLVLAFPSVAQACSSDDKAYFEGFLDTSCLMTPLSNTTLDTFGGLRLTTNGAPVTTSWDTDVNFNTGVTADPTTSGPIGTSTLITQGAGNPATLVLPTTPLPLERDAGNPVLSPGASTVFDNDNVNDPTVVDVTAGGTIAAGYWMWYSGTAEDGSGPAIFVATSSDGISWTKQPNPVLVGDDGAFDEHGVYGADVIYDPADMAAPLKMWYSGMGEIFGAIGYATSVDGVNWTKYDDALTPETTEPVLDHGPAGAPDSFAAADPSILKDGTTWKMWYTGDDSNKRRVAYATSADGIVWEKGGKVIAPEDPGSNANYHFGAWAPTVWKSGSEYKMLLAGRKIVSDGVFQTRIMKSQSPDGFDWDAPSPAINEAANRFDATNLGSPDLLIDPGTPDPYKLYYGGNAVDANGNFHNRIGLATGTSDTSFSRFDGPDSCLKCILDIGLPADAFDAREVSGLSAVAPASANPKFAGFYWGNRGSDFKPRLGEATSGDGSSWSKVTGSATGGALFDLGGAGGFDENGELDPSALYDVDAVGSDDYLLYFAALDATNAKSIGFASAQEDGGTHQPDNGTWSARTQVLDAGSGFDGNGVSHPSIVKDGPGSYVLYYTGHGNAGTSIGRATAGAPNGPFGSRSPVNLSGSNSCDPDGYKDPVVVKAGAGDYRMLYTGVENLDDNVIERACYATSNNGTSWTRQGVVLNPSQEPFSPDEVGVRPTGFVIDGATDHVFYSGIDRTGRVRSSHASTPASGDQIPNGWATYQFGDETTEPLDFRTITRTSSGEVTLWMSFLQPYSTSGSGKQFWSDYFPVTVDPDNPETLNFLLTVSGVRWQARESDPTTSPSLDKVDLEHAPVQFAPSGSATTLPITPPETVPLTAWDTLTAEAEIFSPINSGTGSGTVSVLNGTSGATLASSPLNTNGETTIDINGISPTANPSLKVRFDLASASPYTATPLVRSLLVSYNLRPAPTPPPPPPVLCAGKVATIKGTAASETIVGTPRHDVIAGLGGDDVIKGLGRGDLICGGAGRDRILGGRGADRLLGQRGNDRLVGGGGRDRVVGGAGKDRAFGGPGKDRVVGGGRADYLLGGGRADRVIGGPGKDRLGGGKGRPDVCNGGKGIDRALKGCEIKRRIP